MVQIIINHKKKTAFFVILALFLTFLPIGARYAAIHYLGKAGAEIAEIEDIDINLFTGYFAAEGVRIGGKGLHPVKLARVELNISMLRLFIGTVLVESAVLDGIDGMVENGPDRLGFGLSLVDKTVDKKKPEPVAVAEETEKGLPSVGIGAFSILNSEITYRDEKGASKLAIDTISLTDLYTWKKKKQAHLTINAKINGALLKSDTGFSLFSEEPYLKTELSLTDLDIGNFSGYLSDICTDPGGRISTRLSVSIRRDLQNAIEIKESGFVEITGISANLTGPRAYLRLTDTGVRLDGNSYLKLNGEMQPEGYDFTGSLQNTALNLEAISKTDETKRFYARHKGLKWEGMVKNTTGTGADTEMKGLLELNDLKLIDPNLEYPFASLERFYVNDAKIASFDQIGVGAVGIDAIRIGQPEEITENGEQQQRYPLYCRNINAGRIALDKMTQLSVESVRVDNFGLFLERFKTEGIITVNRLKRISLDILDMVLKKKKPEEPETVAETKTSEEKSGVAVSIDTVEMTGRNTITFKDSSVRPAFLKTIEIDQLTLKNIKSGKDHEWADLVLKLSSSRHFLFDVEGRVDLFSPKANLELKGRLKHLQLPDVSPYVATALGYNVRTGVLNVDIDCRIDANILNVRNDLFLENIRLSPDETRSVHKVAKQFSMPLDQALSILRDSDNNVRLSIPVTGDITNPDFHYRDVFKIALGKAAKTASISLIKNLIQPYGTFVTIGEYAWKGQAYLLKIRLEPVKFQPGQAELTGEIKDYLGKVAQLLKEKENLRLSVGGFAVAADIKEGNISENPEPYYKLAKSRQRQVIEYLEQLGVKHTRLYSSTPMTDKSEKSVPRVELAI